MSQTDNLPPLREVIARCGLSAKKSLGQNFILDRNLLNRIARAAGSVQGQTIIEIGPGPGGLTRALLAREAEKIIAIERDQRCRLALDQISESYPQKMRIIFADATKIDWSEFASMRPKIVANLPYNIATKLLTDWLEVEPWPPWWRSLSVMLQREVAERLVARPNSSGWGRLSVLCQWRARPKIILTLPARAFVPAPKVESALVHIEPRQQRADITLSAIKAVSKSIFGQRRKMLRSSTKTLFSEPLQALTRAGIDPRLRADALELQDIIRLAECYQHYRSGNIRPI